MYYKNIDTRMFIVLYSLYKYFHYQLLFLIAVFNYNTIITYQVSHHR